jgi:hypothetical protein
LEVGEFFEVLLDGGGVEIEILAEVSAALGGEVFQGEEALADEVDGVDVPLVRANGAGFYSDRCGATVGAEIEGGVDGPEIARSSISYSSRQSFADRNSSFTSGSRSASGIVRMYSAFIQMSLSSVQRLGCLAHN